MQKFPSTSNKMAPVRDGSPVASTYKLTNTTVRSVYYTRARSLALARVARMFHRILAGSDWSSAAYAIWASAWVCWCRRKRNVRGSSRLRGWKIFHRSNLAQCSDETVALGISLREGRVFLLALFRSLWGEKKFVCCVDAILVKCSEVD